MKKKVTRNEANNRASVESTLVAIGLNFRGGPAPFNLNPRDICPSIFPRDSKNRHCLIHQSAAVGE